MIYRMPPIPIDGWMTIVELQWLYHNAKRFKTIVEIGSWKGRSTHALLSGASIGGGTVTVIDHWKGTETYTDSHFHEVKNLDIFHVFMASLSKFENLNILKMNSKEGSKHIKQAEMVFIDGDHTDEGVTEDIELWLPKTTKLIAGHDYQPFPGVKRAVVKKFGIPSICDSIWYVDVTNGGKKSEVNQCR